MIDGWVISCELALRWMSLDLTDDKLTLVQVMAWCRQALRWMSLELADDKSTLVQVMAWCRQATSHYLSQCWSRSLSPYGVTRPQWVNHFSYQNRSMLPTAMNNIPWQWKSQEKIILHMDMEKLASTWEFINNTWWKKIQKINLLCHFSCTNQFDLSVCALHFQSQGPCS